MMVICWSEDSYSGGYDGQCHSSSVMTIPLRSNSATSVCSGSSKSVGMSFYLLPLLYIATGRWQISLCVWIGFMSAAAGDKSRRANCRSRVKGSITMSSSSMVHGRVSEIQYNKTLNNSGDQLVSSLLTRRKSNKNSPFVVLYICSYCSCCASYCCTSLRTCSSYFDPNVANGVTVRNSLTFALDLAYLVGLVSLKSSTLTRLQHFCPLRRTHSL